MLHCMWKDCKHVWSNLSAFPRHGDKFKIGKTCPIKILIVDKMGANDIWNVRTNVQLFKEDGICFNLFTLQKTFKVAYILTYVPSPLLPPKLFLIIALYYYLCSRVDNTQSNVTFSNLINLQFYTCLIELESSPCNRIDKSSCV
jgi:hypothetical protein